jgi:hypothetical protein
MAQAASKRSALLRPMMYEDEPSSMSLELFGYHGVVVDSDEADGGSAAAALSMQLAFDDDNFKGGCDGASADYYSSWVAYGGSGATSSSSSSVLSFEQAGSGGQHHLAYGEDGCALWMDPAAGMVEHPAQQQHGSGCNFGLVVSPGSSPDDAGLYIQEPGTVQLPAKAPHKRARRVINCLININSSPKIKANSCMVIHKDDIKINHDWTLDSSEIVT